MNVLASNGTGGCAEYAVAGADRVYPIQDSMLKPHISVEYPLEHFADGLDAVMERSAMGKVVVCRNHGASARQDPRFGTVIERLDSCRKPIIAAIHGTALGGGLEIGLACSHRIAVPGAQFGLPEVKLGLLPGSDSTVRISR